MQSTIVRAALCTLNQWAMDFSGNKDRILTSIAAAKSLRATFRTGPELEVCGYSCEDHFYERDTVRHCWQVVLHVMQHANAGPMLIDLGMPVMHKNVLYNCRVVIYGRQVVLIRPKMILCDDGNYRESRWFTPWQKPRYTEVTRLPEFVTHVTGQTETTFGDAVIVTEDTIIGFEMCEELWNPCSKHIDMSLDGVEIFSNSSASYMQLGKLDVVMDLVRTASMKVGGAYLYANMRGGDGQRVYFNGGSMAAVNGQVTARARQFSLSDVEVTIATIDLVDIRTYRNSFRSRSLMAAGAPCFPRVILRYLNLTENFRYYPPPTQLNHASWLVTQPGPILILRKEEELATGPACWLWDYLRRSSLNGFFLPLSGGVDSSSSAVVVYVMCHLVVQAVASGDTVVLADCARIVGDPAYVPTDPGDLCSRLLFTCYMGTINSSAETCTRARTLAGQIHSNHTNINIDSILSAMISVFRMATGREPAFRVNGGCHRQNLAMQNIQARSRMVMAYLFAQLSLWLKGRDGSLLVLGSSNVDEALRGYMTKYDCSAADVNPIGGISKQDLRLFLMYAKDQYNLPIVTDILEALPTAELEPLQHGAVVQNDEADMGLTYNELNVFGRLRKQQFCGPYSMFMKVMSTTPQPAMAVQIAEKVKHFFRCYAMNRHKMAILTPSFHAESYSPDDNRFDHRQLLYRSSWDWQFHCIDSEVRMLESMRLAMEQHSSNHSPPLFGDDSDNNMASDDTDSVQSENEGNLSPGAADNPPAPHVNVELTPPVAAEVAKSPTGSRMPSSVMGMIKDRTGVPV